MAPSAPVKRPVLTLDEVEEAIGPVERWTNNCHDADRALVKSGLLPLASRVVRGFVRGSLLGTPGPWSPQNEGLWSLHWVVDLARFTWQKAVLRPGLLYSWG
jgi:hypothetical protein